MSAASGYPLPFNTFQEARNALVAEHPHMGRIDEVPANDVQPIEGTLSGTEAIGLAIEDHYLTNPIARASPLMAELSAAAQARENEFNAAAE